MRFSLARWLVPVSCLALFVPGLVSARVSDATTGLSASGQAAGLSSLCSGSATECIATLLGRVLNVLFGFLGIILLGYVLYGGFVWMTSSGGKDVDQAKGILRNAIIGLIIIVSSFSISNFVLGQLGQISGLGSSSGGTDSSVSGAGGGATNPTVDQLTDGGLRLCCYGNPLPAATCINDCQNTPTAFGLTAPVTESACRTACGSRICTGGNASDPRPLAGQSQCRPGEPGGAPTTGGAGGACATFESTLPPTDRCGRCVYTCQRNTICNIVPTNNVGGRPREAATTGDLTTQAGHCRNVVCTGTQECTST